MKRSYPLVSADVVDPIPRTVLRTTGPPPRWPAVNLWTVPRAIGTHLYRATGHAARTVQHVRPLDTDLLENETSYLVLVDTPGVDAAGLDIRYLDGRVQVSVERARPDDASTEGLFLGRAMELTTEVSLPEDAVVDPESGTARLSPVGTVKIELPKEEEPDEGSATVGEEIPIDE